MRMKRFFGSIILVFITYCVVVVICSIPNRSGVAIADDQQVQAAAPAAPQSQATVPADFDWQQYIAHYPDLQQAGIDTKEKAEDHWIKYGSGENRTYIPVGFDWKEYVSLNPDLQQAGIDTKEKAEKHWLDFGFNEKRLYKVVTVPADFDWQQYIANYPDLQQAGVDTKEKAEDHYVKFGYFERRSYAKPSAN